MSAQILIVDDDPVQRRLLEGAANRLGYSAQLCDGGEAALEAMSSEAAPFDAILLDVDFSFIALRAKMEVEKRMLTP